MQPFGSDGYLPREARRPLHEPGAWTTLREGDQLGTRGICRGAAGVPPGVVPKGSESVSVGKRIRRVREREKMSQRAFASAIGERQWVNSISRLWRWGLGGDGK